MDRSNEGWISPRIAQKLAASAQKSDHAMALGNRAGVIEWANQAWTRVTGHPLDDFVSKPVGDFLQHVDLEPGVVDFVGGCFREKKVCEIDIPLTTPAGANIWIHLRVEPLIDASGQVSDFVAIASDITQQKRAESGDGVTIVDLSNLATKLAGRHIEAIGPMTAFDFSIGEDMPPVLVDETLLEGLVGRLICRSAESTREGWGTISISTGLLGDEDGPLFRGNLFNGLPHHQYAYLEVHDTGSAPATGRHQVVVEPFLSSHYPDYAMRIATARLLLHNQGCEIRLKSNAWDGTSVVFLIPYCTELGLERL